MAAKQPQFLSVRTTRFPFSHANAAASLDPHSRVLVDWVTAVWKVAVIEGETAPQFMH